MDDLPGNASSVPHIEPIEQGLWFQFSVSVIFISIILGLIGAYIYIWFPYNRVVVSNQPTSTVIRLSSVHLQKGGFVVVYLNEPPGTRVVGASTYLPPGYYRNLVLPFEFEPVLPAINDIPGAPKKKSYSMLIRLYQDTGDQVFDEQKDRLVRDIFRRPYSRNFWMIYQSNGAIRTLRAFLDHPYESVTDFLFP